MPRQKKTPSPKAKPRWKRSFLWVALVLVLIVLASAGGFYLWFRAQVGASNERVDPEIIEALAESTSTTVGGETAPDRPNAVNIVLLGSDTRSSSGKGGRSDTIILVHVDPDEDFLSMLSIPRDLRVIVPGHGYQKINAAYAYGGPALLIRTIQSSVGVDLDHYVKVDFNAFKEITDALGGVYMDVDREYDDGKIQLDPGYQLLDGQNALRFCRTRHDSNYDFGRMERQQRFLAAVREQAMGWNLAFKLPSLVSATFSNVDTDLSANQIIELAHWAVGLDGERMTRITLVAPTGTIAGASYVLASEKKIARAVASFLAPPSKTFDYDSLEDWPPRFMWAQPAGIELTGIAVNVVNDTGRTGQGALAALWLAQQGAAAGSIVTTDGPPAKTTSVAYPPGQAKNAALVADALDIGSIRQSPSVRTITATLGTTYTLHPSRVPHMTFDTAPTRRSWRSLAAKTSLLLVAPTYVPTGYKYSYQRSYALHVDGKEQAAIKVGYRYGSRDQYLGVGQTAWTEAPLAGPGIEVDGDGTSFTMVGTSTKTERVWWIDEGVLYWVSNTLRYELSGEQLLAIAMSCAAVPSSTADADTLGQ